MTSQNGPTTAQDALGGDGDIPEPRWYVLKNGRLKLCPTAFSLKQSVLSQRDDLRDSPWQVYSCVPGGRDIVTLYSDFQSAVRSMRNDP